MDKIRVIKLNGFTDTSLVSVVVPTFNSEETLEACLRSVKNQTYPHLEMIVVDRYSSDGTVKIAKMFNAKVYLVTSERSVAKNYGAAKAHGSFVLFLDSDMELTPKVVEECVHVCFRKGIDAVVIPQLSIGKGFLTECRKAERSLVAGDQLFEIPRFYKKEVFLNIGGFDKGLILGEDADLRERMERSGHKAVRIKAEVKHHEGNLSFTRIAFKALYYGKSFPSLIKKNLSLAINKAIPARFVHFRNMKSLFEHPALLMGLIFIKLLEYIAYIIGILSTILGSASDLITEEDIRQKGKRTYMYPENTDYWRDRFKIFKSVYPKITGLVLDVGCGNGGFSVLSALEGWEPVFCDYQSKYVDMVSICMKQRSLTGVGVAADARFLPFKRGVFNLVVCVEVLEHVGEDKGGLDKEGFLLEIREAIRELRRVVKKGCCVFVMVPNRMFPLEIHSKIPLGNFLPWFIKRKVLRIVTHYFTKIEVTNLFSDMGFVVLRSGYWTRHRRLSRLGVTIPLLFFGIHLLATKPQYDPIEEKIGN